MCVAGIGSDPCGNMWDFSCCKTRFLPCKLHVKTGFWICGLEGNEDVIGHRYLIYLPIPTAPNLLSTWGFSTKCWCRGTCNRGTTWWCESLRCTKPLIYAMHWSVNGMISGSAYMSLPAVQFNCCLILLGDASIVEENVDTLKTQGFDQGVSLSVWVGPTNPNKYLSSFKLRSKHFSGCCWVYQPLLNDSLCTGSSSELFSAIQCQDVWK